MATATLVLASLALAAALLPHLMATAATAVGAFVARVTP